MLSDQADESGDNTLELNFQKFGDGAAPMSWFFVFNQIAPPPKSAVTMAQAMTARVQVNNFLYIHIKLLINRYIQS